MDHDRQRTACVRCHRTTPIDRPMYVTANGLRFCEGCWDDPTLDIAAFERALRVEGR